MPTHEIDDTDSSIEYFGIWTTEGATHLTLQAGAQLSVTFEGVFIYYRVLGLSVMYERQELLSQSTALLPGLQRYQATR